PRPSRPAPSTKRSPPLHQPGRRADHLRVSGRWVLGCSSRWSDGDGVSTDRDAEAVLPERILPGVTATVGVTAIPVHCSAGPAALLAAPVEQDRDLGLLKVLL